MAKSRQLCSKCGYMYDEFIPCQCKLARSSEDALVIPAVIRAVNIGTRKKAAGKKSTSELKLAIKEIESATKDRDKLVATSDNLEKVVAMYDGQKKARREYMARRRKSCKWALRQIMGMMDIIEIHALTRSILDKDLP